jgi:hypothetical protein
MTGMSQVPRGVRGAIIVLAVLLLCCSPATGLRAAEGGSGSSSILCLPLTVKVVTIPASIAVFMGEKSGMGDMDQAGMTPCEIRFLAVAYPVPGKDKLEVGLLPEGSACPEPGKLGEAGITAAIRYFTIDPLHSGYLPIKNKKKDLVSLKKLQKAIESGEKELVLEIKYTLELPRGEAGPGWK